MHAFDANNKDKNSKSVQVSLKNCLFKKKNSYLKNSFLMQQTFLYEAGLLKSNIKILSKLLKLLWQFEAAESAVDTEVLSTAEPLKRFKLSRIESMPTPCASLHLSVNKFCLADILKQYHT